MKTVNTSKIPTEAERGKGVSFCRLRRVTGY